MLKRHDLMLLLTSIGTWRPYKELLATVERAALYKKTPEVFHELEVALDKFNPDFITLLKNPVRQITDHDSFLSDSVTMM